MLRQAAKRIFVSGIMVLALGMSVAVMSDQAAAKANPRYASYVIDADRGVVLHESNADSKRYPASLTKMMTLYLTFEAIEQGKLTWNSMLPVSDHAARQPQTNISLRKGDKISVKDLVMSLIIRSANDSAVVLAEGIGKTEWNFALQMTRKAQQLGMTRTQFRNPHGLHHEQQYTTAKDMARLGLALLRDYPQHYHLFDEVQFTYKGRTYYTHNKVSRYYEGADGFKTGYINASGFNLVSSAKRNGHRIMAVVMGGRTSKSRDNHMVSLLDRAFNEVGSVNSFEYAFADHPPVPVSKPGGTDLLVAAVSTVVEGVVPSAHASDVKAVTVADHAPTPQLKKDAGVIELASLSTAKPSGTPIPYAKPVSNVEIENEWGVQVGIFRSEREALHAAAAAMTLASAPLTSAEIQVTERGEGDTDGIYRARLGNLDETHARQACRLLQSQKEACFVYKKRID